MKPQTGKRKLKPSGIDWIGDVPEGWKVTRFGYHAAIKANLVDVDDYGSFPQVSPENIEKNTGRLLAHGTVEDSGVISGNHLFKKGQILYSKIRPALNKVTIAPYPGLCCADMYPIETEEDSRFMVYLMLADCFVKQTETVANMRIKMPKINQDELSRIRIAMPPIDEQKRIAAKLDRLCGRIDELSANLAKEIAALQDYRKSLITECVTKGLNSKAKMKPSGVEWIGDVPVGWSVMRTKYVSRVQTGPFGTQLSADSYTEDGSGVPCVNVKNIGDGVFRVDDLDRIQEDVAERLVNYEIRRGDVIFARKGSVDKRTVAGDEQDGWILGSDSIGVRFDEDVFPRYACYYYGNGVMGQHLHKMAKGSTMPSMNAEIIGNLEIIIPPFDEQCRIAALLDEKCAAIDAKIAERQRQLEKLGEYRSSAIYEYVTGKKEVAG